MLQHIWCNWNPAARSGLETGNRENIERLESCKYLGVIDSDMSWKEHIDFVYKKIIKFTSIFYFYKMRTNLNAHVSKMLYFAFVYCRLLYGIEIMEILIQVI